MVRVTRQLPFTALASAMFLLSTLSIQAGSPQPQPTPTAKAQATPKRPRAAPEVIGVQLRPIKMRVGQPCPTNSTFYGAITTNGAITVQYTWASSNGRSWPTRNLKFLAAGTKSVNVTWKLGKPGQKVDEWLELQIVAPNRMTSSKAIENFTCAK